MQQYSLVSHSYTACPQLMCAVKWGLFHTLTRVENNMLQCVSVLAPSAVLGIIVANGRGALKLNVFAGRNPEYTAVQQSLLS